MLKVKVTSRNLEELRHLSRVLPASGVALAGARAAGRMLRERFLEFDQSRPNKHGWPRQHFWKDVAETVTAPVQRGDSATVAVTHFAIRQRVLGGPIVPRNRKWLTLPNRREAYGKRAADFPGLRFCFTARGAALALPGEEPHFILRRRVHQKPDPSILPTDQEVAAYIRVPVLKFVARRLKEHRLSPTN